VEWTEKERRKNENEERKEKVDRKNIKKEKLI
jgi:hypothetical protein